MSKKIDNILALARFFLFTVAMTLIILIATRQYQKSSAMIRPIHHFSNYSNATLKNILEITETYSTTTSTTTMEPITYEIGPTSSGTYENKLEM